MSRIKFRSSLSQGSCSILIFCPFWSLLEYILNVEFSNHICHFSTYYFPNSLNKARSRPNKLQKHTGLNVKHQIRDLLVTTQIIYVDTFSILILHCNIWYWQIDFIMQISHLLEYSGEAFGSMCTITNIWRPGVTGYDGVRFTVILAGVYDCFKKWVLDALNTLLIELEVK